jgi:hypothetical protein
MPMVPTHQVIQFQAGCCRNVQSVGVASFWQDVRLNIRMREGFHRIVNGVNDRIGFFDFPPKSLCFIDWGLTDFGKNDLRNDANSKFHV